MTKTQKKFLKKLKNKFDKSNSKEYSVIGAIRDWLSQCGIEPSDKNLNALVQVNGGMIFYPYQELDRLVILETLKVMKQRDKSSKKSK